MGVGVGEVVCGCVGVGVVGVWMCGCGRIGGCGWAVGVVVWLLPRASCSVQSSPCVCCSTGCNFDWYAAHTAPAVVAQYGLLDPPPQPLDGPGVQCTDLKSLDS